MVDYGKVWTVGAMCFMIFKDYGTAVEVTDATLAVEEIYAIGTRKKKRERKGG